MYLLSLSLSNYRNFTYADVTFSPDLNLIYGRNAQGKTNLLEAVYLLCLARSFRTKKNEDLIHEDSRSFTVSGRLVVQDDLTREIVVHCSRDVGKEIAVDGKRLARHSELVGSFPVVVMAPEDYGITQGAPAERRRFLDVLISQLDVTYLASLQEYQRVLRQRNRLLQAQREGKWVADNALAPWNETLVKHGTAITLKRKRVVAELAELLKELYREHTGTKDLLDVRLVSSIDAEPGVDAGARFLAALGRTRAQERALGRTVVGPHRDDLDLRINGRDLRRFGSRGEHKSALLCLKVAEFRLLRARKEVTPILLVDDYHSELDSQRERNVLEALVGVGQAFLTSPKEQTLDVDRALANHFRSCVKCLVEGGTAVVCDEKDSQAA